MQGISDFLSGTKGRILVISLALLGCFLIIVPDIIKNNEKARTDAAPEEIAAYSAMLESGVREAVCRVTGSDNVSVMITLESTFENVYVSDAVVNEAVTAEKTDRQSEKQLVLTGAGDSGMPVVVKKIPPRVKGAVIVCQGGNNSDIKNRVTAIAATVLNLSETKIYVTGGY